MLGIDSKGKEDSLAHCTAYATGDYEKSTIPPCPHFIF